jgi:ribosomal protein L11 methyltransferase
LIRLAVRCRPELAEQTLAALLELAPGGVEQDEAPDYVEYAIYGWPGELPELPQLEATAGDGLVEITVDEVPEDWADRWRDFHLPITVGDRIQIRPSWEDQLAGDILDVVIDPGRAFGTGAHATTRLCIELLLELADSGGAQGALVDLGTGSGVLALAAARLGWAPVAGCDYERTALDAAAENARVNGIELELSRVDLRRQAPPLAPTMTANLTAELLLAVAGRLAERGELPRELVCSGLLDRQAGDVVDGFAAAGLDEARRLTSGEWVAISFAPP